jgi:hypothetical protein
MMAENRVVSYAQPLKDNPEFLLAMARCNYARDNFVPLRKQKKAVKK